MGKKILITEHTLMNSIRIEKGLLFEGLEE
jgi:hypothetical protein